MFSDFKLLAMVPLLFLSFLPLSPIQSQENQTTEKVKVRLLASLAVPGTLNDLSGLAGDVSEGIPAKRFGGWGSGICQGAEPGTFWLISDRGPLDGASTFLDRMHQVELVWDAPKIRFQLKKTVLLKDSKERNLVGDKREIASGLRFDPESIRSVPGPQGERLIVSDEYGPDVREFDASGKEIASFEVPQYYRVRAPDQDPELEAKNNKEGRAPNKGFEGISVDGTRLVVANQGPLIQDAGDQIEGYAKKGTLLRFLIMDTDSRKAKGEYLYSLDDPKKGVSEILHWEKDRFLVLERDSLGGAEAKAKAKCIYWVDLSHSKIMPLSARLVEGEARQKAFLKKNLLVDLTQLGIPAELMPAKWEGMAWGPLLPSGNRLLWVTADNDFVKEKPSWIYALEVGDK